uniref:Glucosidase 2 subunit beta n=1 Tax=Kalanchoe fedtschenkoi TaxID=63787 RepID=A0A7N0U9R1_KALFE
MKQAKTLAWTLVVVQFFLASIARSASIDPLLGVSPEDAKYYKSFGDSIKCKDGSNKFSRSHLNDDFCDCPDGSDEPGTSACPNGSFYCQNAGHVAVTLYSSRVNDGICDCCDGSDEYDGQIKCKNTCWEAGKVARDKLKKKIATYQEGVTLRKQEIEKAKVSIANEEAELSKLKSEEKILKDLVQQLKDRKEQIEKVEERLRKEKEEDEKKKVQETDIEKTKTVENPVDEKENLVETKDGGDVGLVEDPLADLNVPEDYDDTTKEEKHEDDTMVENQDILGNQGPLQHEEKHQKDVVVDHQEDSHNEDSLVDEKKDKVTSESVEELSREELGRRVASRWTGESTDHQAEGVHDVKNEDHDETPKDVEDEEYGYDSETDDERGSYDDNDFADDHIDEDPIEEDSSDAGSSHTYESDDDSDTSDFTPSSSPSWLEKIQQTVHSIIQAVNLFKTPVNISDAAHVRKEYEESNAKLSKITSRISSLTKKLKQDFGPEKEFYSFYGRCFESKQNKYVYKICPYKQATQEEGHSATRLGNWDKFEDSYRTVVFSNGDKCWNGPDRSMKVKLRCGLSNEVTDVEEPSRCEYVALLSTPALCHGEKLKELQEKFDHLNKQQPQGHDEL